MDNELVHVTSFFSETRDTITTCFTGAKLMFEDWIVSCADDGKVVGHVREESRRIIGVIYTVLLHNLSDIDRNPTATQFSREKEWIE